MNKDGLKKVIKMLRTGEGRIELAGICTNLLRVAPELLRDFTSNIKNWEHFSGHVAYPIPASLYFTVAGIG